MKKYTDFEKFAKKVGLMDEEDFKKLSIKPDEDRGAFETERLTELKYFCRNNPKYHIITQTNDGDDEEEPSITYENGIRYINRLNYFLGNKNKDRDIYLVEVL